MCHVTCECDLVKTKFSACRVDLEIDSIMGESRHMWRSHVACECNTSFSIRRDLCRVDLGIKSFMHQSSHTSHITHTHTHTHTHTYECITRHVNVTRQKPVRCVCYDSLMCLDLLMNMFTSRSTQYYIGFRLFSWSLCGACRDDLEINLLMSESCQIWIHHEVCECDTSQTYSYHIESISRPTHSWESCNTHERVT